MCPVIYIDAVTGKKINHPSESIRAKAAGNPVTEIPNPELPPPEEDSQTEDIDNG